MSGDERITDPATIRTYWEDDEETTRIARRVGAALNSGRDAAVVQVVLDETETMRATIERVRALADSAGDLDNGILVWDLRRALDGDPRPQPGDGPEYHHDLAFWLARHPEAAS